ncbi:hypothetical protein SSTU70S_00687 [Stutzerimonas stutzeri]
MSSDREYLAASSCIALVDSSWLRRCRSACGPRASSPGRGRLHGTASFENRVERLEQPAPATVGGFVRGEKQNGVGHSGARDAAHSESAFRCWSGSARRRAFRSRRRLRLHRRCSVLLLAVPSFGRHRAAEARSPPPWPPRNRAEQAADRGDVERIEPAAAAVLHQAHGGTGAPEGAVDRGREVGVPVLGGHAVDADSGQV